MNGPLPAIDPNDVPSGPVTVGSVYVFEVSASEAASEAKKHPRTAEQLLQFMIARREVYGSPIPEGFVPPPGIDLGELLKRLPPITKPKQ
jgi:hypothetical protein